MIAPHKKPPSGELSETAKEASRSTSRIRRAGKADHRPYSVSPGESTRTDCRRPLRVFEQTITAALALCVFKTTL